MHGSHQVNTPLPDYRLSASNRSAQEVAGTMFSQIDIEPSYQRGAVWVTGQRIALVKSWIMGVPIPAVILNNRDTPEWRTNEGDAVYQGEAPTWAVVDGKQRIMTARLWFSGDLQVPASWFPVDRVARATRTNDGPYVTYRDLTPTGQRVIGRAQLPVIEAKLPSVRAEAELYLLVNGGGTGQTPEDMARAGRVAHNGTGPTQ
jgi:hypothetical protein